MKTPAWAVVALSGLLVVSALQAQATEDSAEPAPPPTIESLEEQSRKAFAEGDALKAYETNLALHERRPYEGQYMYDAVRAAALLDRKSEAYEMMLKMQRQGLSYDFDQTEDSVNIRPTQLYGYLNDLMVEAGKPVGDGKLAFKLPGAGADYQAIAWDGGRGKFLVGTAKKGLVLAVGEDGSTEVLLEAGKGNGMWSINGLAVDIAGNRLWVSSAATPKFAGFNAADQNHGALFEFNLETLELVQQYFVPIDALRHELGSLAATADGHVYVADRLTPIVYRKVPDGKRLEAYVGSQELVSFSDIAVTPDNSRIFVADRVKGIFVVDPVAEQAAMLIGQDNLNLGGIEGIEYVNGQLIIIQGGLRPQRLLRLQLDASGYAVQSITPMAVALPEFDQPGTGAVRGEALYYFANQASTDAEGETLVLATRLDAGSEIVPPDMRKFQQSIQNRKRQAE